MLLPDHWWRLDATAQAELVRDGVASPSALVEAAIERIEVLNPAIDAVITPLYEEGRRIASELPDAGQPFRGVPILLKDAGDELDGTPYYRGTSVLRDIDYRSKRTTELVRRLLAAGFVPIGKTNVPELSYGFATKPPAFGPTRNPWDLTRTAGGSSGGSAAAVAVGLVGIAQGSDGNGSIRVPAACCGLVTLRPSRGLVPAAIPRDLPDPGPNWMAFVLARSTRDLSGTLDAVANAEPVEDLAPDRLRIGVLAHDPEWPNSVHSDVAAAVRYGLAVGCPWPRGRRVVPGRTRSSVGSPRRCGCTGSGSDRHHWYPLAGGSGRSTIARWGSASDSPARPIADRASSSQRRFGGGVGDRAIRRHDRVVGSTRCAHHARPAAACVAARIWQRLRLGASRIFADAVHPHRLPLPGPPDRDDRERPAGRRPAGRAPGRGPPTPDARRAD